MKNLLLILTCLVTVASFGQTNAVIESSETTYEINSPTSATLSYSRKVKVLNEQGIRNGFLVDYIDKFRSISSVKVVLYDANGDKVEKYSKSDGVEVNFNPSYQIDDSKIFYINTSRKIFPYTVELSYEVDYRGYIAFPRWYPQSQYGVEVKSSSFTVKYVNGQNFEVKSYNGMSEPTVTQEEDTRIYHWMMQNMPSITEVPYTPSLRESQPFVTVVPEEFELDGEQGSFKSWADFGNWFNQLNTDLGDLSESTKVDIDQLKEKAGNRYELIRLIYKYMQDKTRYVSIQLGIGGFQSLPVDFVDANGYGDCKALSTYTKAMLNYAGIDANYVLVNAGEDEPGIITDLPSSQFNHVFLAVPGELDTVWLECTSQLVPPNYMGTFTDDRDVLWVNGNQSEIIRSKKYHTSDNVKESQAVITVNEEGNATCAIDSSKKGVLFSDAMVYQSLDEKRLKDYNYKQFDFADFEVVDFSYELDNGLVELREKYDLVIRNFAKKVRGKMVIKAGVLGDNMVISSWGDEHSEMDIRRGKTYYDDYEIELPENFRVGILSDPVEFESEVGEYSIFMKEVNGKIMVRRTLKINNGKYTDDAFLKAKDFFDRVRKADNSKILLVSKT